MPGWPELSQRLRDLAAREPSPLSAYPMPDSAQGPPYGISLQPWAESVAAQLYAEFGGDLRLTVGALPYPPDRGGSRATAEIDVPPLPPGMAEVDVDGDAVVASGHDARLGLLLTNRSGRTLTVDTNGIITADVVDPASGQVVGRYVGARHLPLVRFRAEPGETTRIPLLVGTASVDLRLGYAVPAGEWGMRADIRIGPVPDRTVTRRTRILSLTVVDQV